MTKSPPPQRCPKCRRRSLRRLIGTGGGVFVDNFIPQELVQLPPDPTTGKSPFVTTKRECEYQARKHGFLRNQGMSHDSLVNT